MSINITTTTTNATESALQLTKFANKQKLPLSAGFLTILKTAGRQAQVFLVNGICLKSAIVAHNEKFVLILDRSGKYNLINWIAISTVSSTGYPADNVDIELNGEILEKATLKVLCENKVSVYLLNGIKLTGIIEAFDDGAIFLSAYDKNVKRENDQIIQLDSIASICAADEYQRNYNA